MLAIIGDGHNNAGSLAIHKKFGFTVAGQLRSVGYKMGDWRDTLISARWVTATGRYRSDIRRQIPARGVNALAGLPFSAVPERRQPPSCTNTGTRPDCPAALRLPGLRKGQTRCQIT